MRFLRALALGLAPGVVGAGLGGCSIAAPLPEPPSLATARVAGDFETYVIERVGLLPFAGVGAAEAGALAEAFYAELSRSTPYEIVVLAEEDLAEIRASDPHRRGWYAPETLVSVARRYRLDALVFGTVTRSRFHPPLELSLQVDLVSAETGMVVWASAVHLDAADERVREGLRRYYAVGGDDEGEEWTVALLSPSRFARFAAYEVARVL